VANGAMTHTLIDRYLELLKKSVLEELYFDNEIRLIYLRQCVEMMQRYSRLLSDDGFEPELRHRGMAGDDPLGQRPLQVFDRVFEVQRAEGRRDPCT